MTKEGWYTRTGIKVSHYVPTIDGHLAPMALCGAREDATVPWLSKKLPRRCKRCEAIIKKGQVMQKEGWYSRKGASVAHYVEVVGESGTLYASALCGAHETPKESWGSSAGIPQCKRCWDALTKQRAPETSRNVSEPEIKNPKAIDMQVQYSQVIGETTPLTWIPVPDVKVIIDLLKRKEDSESCRISRAVVHAAIKELQTRIHEAEERCSRPSEVTTTWAHGGEEEE